MPGKGENSQSSLRKPNDGGPLLRLLLMGAVFTARDPLFTVPKFKQAPTSNDTSETAYPIRTATLYTHVKVYSLE